MNKEKELSKSQELEIELYRAIRNNDLQKVKIVLEEKSQFDRWPYSSIVSGATCLHDAAGLGYNEICEILIDSGIDINWESYEPGFETPLGRAATYGHLETVKWLISRGATVDGTARTVCTPLMTAAINGHLEVARYLIESGAEVNRIHGRRPKTALDYAMTYGHGDIAELLRKHGGIELQGGPTDWSQVFGGPIISHIESNVGRVLPISTTQIVGESEIELRICMVDSKDKYKLLFTIGLFNTEQSIELIITLPGAWPLQGAALQSGSKLSFPMALLLKLVELVNNGEKISEGYLVREDDPRLSGLKWPGEIEALIAINHNWPGEDLSKTEEPPIEEKDRVRLFMLMPIKKTKSGIPKGNKMTALIEKLRKAKWGKMVLSSRVPMT